MKQVYPQKSERIFFPNHILTGQIGCGLPSGIQVRREGKLQASEKELDRGAAGTRSTVLLVTPHRCPSAVGICMYLNPSAKFHLLCFVLNLKFQ